MWKPEQQREAGLFQSGTSSATWAASELCDELGSNGSSGGSGGQDGVFDCDPGTLRLRLLLQEADRAHSISSNSSSSSFSDADDSETDEEGGEGAMGLAGRAASAPELMMNNRAVAPDEEGAAELAAALEAVLLNPLLQPLARSASCPAGKGCGGFSGLAPSSDAHVGSGDEKRSQGDGRRGGRRSADDGGDGSGGRDTEADDVAADAAAAVEAVLAWSFNPPRLPCVVEEAGGVASDQDEKGTARDKGAVQEDPTSRDGCDVVDDSDSGSGVCSGGDTGEKTDGCPQLDTVGSSGGSGDSGGRTVRKARRWGSESGESSGAGAGTRSPSPVVSASGSVKTDAPEAAACGPTTASSCEAMAVPADTAPGGHDSRSHSTAVSVTPTFGAGAGFEECCGVCPERSKTQDGPDLMVIDNDNSNREDGARNGDDDEQRSDRGGDGSNNSNSNETNILRRKSVTGATSNLGLTNDHLQQRRRGSITNMCERRCEEDGEATVTVAPARRRLLHDVVGAQAGAEAGVVASVRRSKKNTASRVVFAAAGRIAALPPQELALLAELDRSSDDDGDDGSDGGEGEGKTNTALLLPTPTTPGVKQDATAPLSLTALRSASSPKHVAPAAPTPPAAAAGKSKPALVRVGHEEAAGDGDGGGVPYRYRRLAGSGRRWPPRVDPASREQWLCAVEFQAVFAMTFAEFKALPRWKRVILKQEVRLF